LIAILSFAWVRLRGKDKTMYDLIVIGGGPAGTSAAITSARNGARVLLLERGRLPRHKVCGEFVSSESLGLLADLLTAQDQQLLADAVRIPRARIFLDGRTIETRVDPPAASIARLNLDAALWSSAERSGVEGRRQVVVQSVLGNDPFLVTASAGTFESRALINASGRWSNLNRAPADTQQAGVKWLGLKGHFAESSSPASVDLYFFDGGYCGVQPVNVEDRVNPTRVNVCAMVRADVASTLPEVFNCHPGLQTRSCSWQALSDPVSTSPLIFREPQPERDRILMVGDAAAFVDPFVGDGISLALRSGRLASDCLRPFFDGNVPLPEAASSYRLAYERQLAPVFRMSSKLRRILRLPQIIRMPILSLLEGSPAIKQYLVSRTR
jgi:menaquinone-9 beta-reductase